MLARQREALFSQVARIATFVRRDASWRADMARALGVFFLTRCVISIFVWLTGQHYHCYGHRCTDVGFFSDNYLLNGLFQWDAIHYRNLAEHGYFLGQGFDTTAPFFPGFPNGVRLFGWLFGNDLLGGIVMNNLAAILAAFFLARLVRGLQLGGSDSNSNGVQGTAIEATLFWLAAPLTLFFSVFLSESLFGLASVMLIWAVVTGRWWVVALAGIVATNTRNAGIILVAAGAIVAWERRKQNPITWWAALCFVGAMLGFAAFLWDQYAAFGEVNQWVEAQHSWNRYLVWPWQTFQDDWIGFPSLDPSERNVDRMYRTQEVLAMAMLLPLFFFRRRLRIPWGLWLLGLGNWLLPVMSHSLISIARYQAANVYFALVIPALMYRYPIMRALVWWVFGLVLAFYLSTYPFGVWAT